MTERTRQNILGIFLGGVLAVTVGAVWLFAAQRQGEITALGQTITAPNLGFAIRMPRGWEPVAAYRRLLANSLAYRQPLTSKAVYDSFTGRRLQRRIFFIAIRPNASDAEVLDPLGRLAIFWDANDDSFHSYRPIQPGPPRLDSLGYERRVGVITFRYRTLRSRFTLIRYEQIRAGGQVFWCVMAGNTQLNEADKALLEAVASSFEFLGERIQKSDQSEES